MPPPATRTAFRPPSPTSCGTPTTCSRPDLNAKEASAAFDRTESEALAVVDTLDDRQVIGMLTESHTLKRYSDELDRQRRAMQGESD